MKKQSAREIAARAVDMEGADRVRIRILVGPDDGASHFVMRMFDVEPGGHTPRHSHEHEHGIYVLEGRGVVATEDGEIPIGPGDVLCIAPSDLHQFRNVGDVPLRFLCVIPAL